MQRSLSWTVTFAFGLMMITGRVEAQDSALTHGELREALKAKPQGEEAARLADRIRGWFGKENLVKGPPPKLDGLAVA